MSTLYGAVVEGVSEKFHQFVLQHLFGENSFYEKRLNTLQPLSTFGSQTYG